MSTTTHPSTTATTVSSTPAAGDPPAAPALPEVAAQLLGLAAGYVGARTVQLGLRAGIVEALAAEDGGLSPDELARTAGIDPLYAGVWCRSAVAAGVAERHGERVTLGPHVATLLLDGQHPAHNGALFRVLEQPELFDTFGERLETGERTWWDRCGHDFVAGVAATGTPFYVRLVPDGLERIEGLTERLRSGARVLDTACGSGAGVVWLAEHYPEVEVVGVDGDVFSLERAAERVAGAGLGDRVELVHSPLEAMELDGRFDLVVNNISMHECRDIDEVTRRVRALLRPGGWFVISDFPFPDSDAGLRTVPGRIMSGIQFFEAQIDDQLVPVSAYLDLLARHGFTEVGTATLAPVHALTFGRTPGA